MSAWGGHRNGQIPLAALEYVGIGVRSGEPQYLQPTVAQAWRNLQAAFRARGVSLLITEGYRTLALQQAYWDRKQADPKAPAAARPGTSNHGWGTAVDMANYLAIPASTRRQLIRDAGFSTATGDRVGEPWHIEYVAALAPTAPPGTPISPTNPATPGTEPTMALKVIGPLGLDDRGIIGEGFGYAFSDRATFEHVCNVWGLNPNQVQWVGSQGDTDERKRDIFNTIINVMREGGAPAGVITTLKPVTDGITEVRRDIAAIRPSGGGATDLKPVLDAIGKVPTAEQNGAAARAAIVR